VAREHRVNLVAFIMGSCPPLKVPANPPGGRYDYLCEKSNALALEYVRSLKRQDRKVKVVLGSNWSWFRRLYLELDDESESRYGSYLVDMVKLSHRGTPRLFPVLGKVGVPVDVIAQAGTVPDPAPPCSSDPFACNLPRGQAIYQESATRKWIRGLSESFPGRSRYIDYNDRYCGKSRCFGFRNGIYTFLDELHFTATRSRAFAAFFRPSVRDLL